MRSEAKMENPLIGQQELRLHNKREWLKDVQVSKESESNDEVGEMYKLCIL